MPPITIALATYRGARFLQAQLDSIAAQDFTDWRLLASDDGSEDGTWPLLAEFAARQPAGRVQLIRGPQRGATANFLNLIGALDPLRGFAFCDQDDVWRPDKLARAAAFLRAQDGPAAYAARTTICDRDLNPLTPAPAFTRPLGFRNALVQACMPGNTTVGNPAALRLLQAAAPAARAAEVISHDWWVYQLLSGAGAVLTRDRAEVLFYRQHPGNVMGRNDTVRARVARFSMLSDGRFAGWLDRNQAALEPVAHLLTDDSRNLLARFGAARRRVGPVTAAAFLRMGLYRQSRAGTMALLAAACAGRLRARPGGIPTSR